MKKIIYAGDSTVTFNKIWTYPQTGLSQGLTWYLKDDVFLKSFAVNGRSTKSFIDEGRLSAIEEEISEGDFLFIQFGHNDEKKEDPKRFANCFTDYKDNLKLMAKVALVKNAFPVIISSLARRNFDEKGFFRPGSHGDYPIAAKEAAGELGIPFVDLCSISEDYLARLGDFASRPMYMYPKDNSHLSMHGAVCFAGMIADELIKFGRPYSDLFVSRTAATFDDNLKDFSGSYFVFASGDKKGGESSFADETDN